MLGACSFRLDLVSEAAPDAAVTPDAPPQDFHLRIEALIDGESHLVIRGTTLHWRHFQFAAPGRWDQDGGSPWTRLPTRLDGADWLPAWPDQPTPENRDCNGCESSTTELAVGVPRAPSTVRIMEVQTRRAQGVVQMPSAANDWELIVLVSDVGVGGAAPYILEIDVVVGGS